MRPRTFGGARAQNPLAPFAPGSIFQRDVTALALASDQTPASKVGNQLSYNRTDYTHWYGYTGPGYTSSGKPTHATLSTFTITLWVVPAGQPTEKITYIQDNGEPQPPGAATNLQSHFKAVPVPTLAKIPGGGLVTAEGTDGWMCIWQPSTNQMWETWKLAGSPGSLTMRYGGYVPNVNGWNGIFPNNWGARATSLALIGGMISLQDIIEVLRGGSINHALAIDIPVTDAEGPIAPATRQDRMSRTPELYEGSPNPAFGSVDGVAESSWFRFPVSSHPNEYGIVEPLEVAIYEAIRKYGVFVADTGGQAPTFNIESPLPLGSPYSWAKVNPLAGAPTPFGSFPYIPAAWKDSTLPKITQEIEGSFSIFTKQPWQNLELLAPRSS
jgi:hypothetical protein